eukprot:TRINITY_DN72027_c0_g1_i1.p1 TRINITY_DN72027_c0_g1~~TRINITY_DN72027_c0_g1_i1.p1  ORF type:complete len:697 (-),score=79.17 TRINITY_DN72027_c0_g1_i1:123-1925(-)
MGRLCGVAAGVENASYLYWCSEGAAAGGQMELIKDFPICVSQCPDPALWKTMMQQAGYEVIASRVDASAFRPVHQCYSESTHAAFEAMDYSTFLFAGRYCLPQNLALATEVLPSSRESLPYLAGVVWSEVVNNWKLLAYGSALTLVMGLAYIYLLNVMGPTCIRLSLANIVVYPLLVACVIYLHGGGNGTAAFGRPQEHASEYFCIFLVCAACALGVFVCFECRYASNAVKFVQVALECIWNERTLQVEPIFAWMLKVVVLAPLCCEFMLLMTSETELYSAQLSFIPDSQHSRPYLSAFAFLMVWCYILLSHLSFFATAYAAQFWYFTPYVDGQKMKTGWRLLEGYWVALRYHLGTICLGSFLTAFVWPFRMLFDFSFGLIIQSNARGVNRLRKLCCCCRRCFDCMMEPVSRVVYLDVCLTSSGFLEASKRSVSMMHCRSPAMTDVYKGCWVFHPMGFSSLAMPSMLLLQWQVSRSAFTVPNNEEFLQEPFFFILVSALISLVAASGFVCTVDATVESLLFCVTSDQLRFEDIQKKLKEGRPSEEGGFFSQMLSYFDDSEAAMDVSALEPVTYMPFRLQRLLAEQRLSQMGTGGQLMQRD